MFGRAQIPMFATSESSAFVIDVLRACLPKHLDDRASMHGVFMDILGQELISRGNDLVLVEAAVRNTILHLRGKDTCEEFSERQRKTMASGVQQGRWRRGR